MKTAINGERIAGPALAYRLHRSGHEVVPIERARQFRSGGYVIDFWGVGYRRRNRVTKLMAIPPFAYIFIGRS